MIYLPTLAITAVSDMNPFIVASLVGILCILYTFLGGFEGVVWSDFIQGYFTWWRINDNYHRCF